MKNLQKVADALGIELATLWAGPEAIPATEVQAAMVDEMGHLTPAQQEALLAMARTMRTPG